MALLSGARLGPYEIVAPLGQGGMGEVYRARDTKLNREVALKVLPDRVQSASFALFSASLAFLEGYESARYGYSMRLTPMNLTSSIFSLLELKGVIGFSLPARK